MTPETRAKIGFTISVLSGIISMTVGIITLRQMFLHRYGGNEN
jgi:hypothetical protein